MKEIKVVIGANFGDEGKGLFTDYFSSQHKNGIVVRFNGGSQASHTVTTSNGNRHAFSHFCSGTLVGLPSYLSSFFIANPILFRKEFEIVSNFAKPKVYLNKDCLVATPYDMMINQIVEINRGVSRHGSCGLGFNETIERNRVFDYGKISVRNLFDKNLMAHALDSIRKYHIPMRLKSLGVSSIPKMYQDLFKDDSIIENYLDDIDLLLDNVNIIDNSVLDKYDSVIFEGAQGLRLDQSHKYFPHVTRSNTGIKNVVSILEQSKLKYENMDIVYITRPYLTRHGAGQLPNEFEDKPYLRIEDLTNVPNPYQGTIRYGLLDINNLSEEISNDLLNIKDKEFKYDVSLGISCMDQIDEEIDYILDSKKLKTNQSEFIENVLKVVGVDKGYVSYGPTRDTIKELEYKKER